MKKIGIFLLLGIAFVASCSKVPTEELENAKTALERAQSVEAAVWSETEYYTAEEAYISATNNVAKKAYADAKANALLTITNANLAYDIAVEKRATDIYEKVEFLYESALTYFADKLMPEEWATADADFAALTEVYIVPDYLQAYELGNPLYDTLSEIVSYAKEQFEKAKNAITDAQDQYDRAANMDIVIKYTLEDLEAAEPLIEEARTLYEAGELEAAVEKANEALGIIDSAISEAERLYQEELAQKQAEVEKLNLKKIQEKETLKKQAEEALKNFEKDLQDLEEELEEYGLGFNGISPFTEYASIAAQTFLKVGADAARSNTGGTVTVDLTDETLSDDDVAVEGMVSITSDYESYQNIKDEDVTLELVRTLFKLAEEAYEDEEYIMTVEYYTLGKHYMDILKSRVSETTYTVVLNVEDRDCLWKIAGRFYDSRYWMWPLIWRANKYLIEDPDLIYPGQEFSIPPSLDK